MLKKLLSSFVVLTFSVCLALVLSYLGIRNESISLLFLLAVLGIAMLTTSVRAAILSALSFALLFNFFFTEPKFSLLIYQVSDFVLLGFFLITGCVAGYITSSLKHEKSVANANANMAHILYDIASSFQATSGTQDILKKGEDLIATYTQVKSKIKLGAMPSNQASFAIQGNGKVIGTIELFSSLRKDSDAIILQSVAAQLAIVLEREKLFKEQNKIASAMHEEKQRSTLLRSIAHDLRSPLTAIAGSSSLLADNYASLSNDERQDLASNLHAEIIWLCDLVENILNMTRISENRLILHKDLEVVDDLVLAAVKHVERLAVKHEIKVNLPNEIVMVQVDAQLITQVIVNLLSNAIRHTPDFSLIELVVDASSRDFLSISVKDSGNGVPNEIKDTLFESFVTKKTHVSDAKHGLGLGLAICKTIVEAHGGTISVRDNQPKGAIFTFTLPMEQAYV